MSLHWDRDAVVLHGDVEVANYCTTGTDELAAEVAGRVGTRPSYVRAISRRL